ncbi:hypothetical protein [Nitrosospira sp. Nsp2]|uniref:hypothetical protein n=1 Tax=Nitrosospira sp. Nsp2 TaxID=136548 RepID=UPI0015E6FC12|nr:hypothetical protein [Nitrosospira sp. Nsp2]
MHEEKPLAVEQIVAVLKEPEGGMPVEGGEPRVGLRSKGFMAGEKQCAGRVPASIPQ